MNPPLPEALRAEIDADPEDLGYAGRVTSGDDAGVAVLLNDRRFPGRRYVPVSEVLALARERGLTPRIRQFAGVVPHLPPPPGVPEAAQLAALAAVDLFMSADRSVDLDLPVVAAVLGGLEAATLLTTYTPDGSGTVLVDGATNRAAILALGDATFSRAEVLWGEGTAISLGQVAAAFGRV